MRRVLPCGSDAVLVECADRADAAALWQWLVRDPPPGVQETVPGARTVLVLGDVDAGLRRALATTPGTSAEPAWTATVTIPVRYDGEDLAEVADTTGLTADAVIDRHASATYAVAFGGFVPGFAYLSGLDEGLRLARRATPRTRVAAGSVAIADGYTAVYPLATPGGWHLIGSTDLVLFDPARQPPARLLPGMRVRFEAI